MKSTKKEQESNRNEYICASELRQAASLELGRRLMVVG